MSWFSTSHWPISRARPVHEVDVARREAGLEQQLEQPARRERRELRRLDDDGVARRQRRRDLVATMFSGELNEVMPQTTPRGTRIVNAMRCACPGAASIGTISPASRLLSSADTMQRLHGARDLGDRVGDRQPAFGGDQRGELVAMPLDRGARRPCRRLVAVAADRAATCSNERARRGDGGVDLVAAGATPPCR